MAPGQHHAAGAASVAPAPNLTSLDAIITVQQPFASAIFLAGKDVENRTWTTNYRGRLWIHAAVRSRIAAPRKLHAALRPIHESDPPRGAILGHVELVDVVRNHPSLWSKRGQFHWLLADPVLLARPIPYQGRQSLTMVDPASFLPRRTRSASS